MGQYIIISLRLEGSGRKKRVGVARKGAKVARKRVGVASKVAKVARKESESQVKV
ncbi:hypothetical protein ACTQ5K_22995 [Niallia sp. Sow4_A1]|uniref:hypothetical protein n=1 Tax=Niallia sp. Sow4_A1 TaxID=3438793 RepID=UPI003F9581B6